MGAAYFIILEKSVDDFDGSSICGKSIAQASDQLQEMAKAGGVIPLTSFISVSAEEVADMFGDDALAGITPPLQWFDPAEGIKSVRYLREHILENQESVESSDRVIEDLRKMEEMLHAAEKARIRFRIAVDI